MEPEDMSGHFQNPHYSEGWCENAEDSSMLSQNAAHHQPPALSDPMLNSQHHHINSYRPSNQHFYGTDTTAQVQIAVTFVDKLLPILERINGSRPLDRSSWISFFSHSLRTVRAVDALRVSGDIDMLSALCSHHSSETLAQPNIIPREVIGPYVPQRHRPLPQGTSFARHAAVVDNSGNNNNNMASDNDDSQRYNTLESHTQQHHHHHQLGGEIATSSANEGDATHDTQYVPQETVLHLEPEDSVVVEALPTSTPSYDKAKQRNSKRSVANLAASSANTSGRVSSSSSSCASPPQSVVVHSHVNDDNHTSNNTLSMEIDSASQNDQRYHRTNGNDNHSPFPSQPSFTASDSASLESLPSDRSLESTIYDFQKLVKNGGFSFTYAAIIMTAELQRIKGSISSTMNFWSIHKWMLVTRVGESRPAKSSPKFDDYLAVIIRAAGIVRDLVSTCNIDATFSATTPNNAYHIETTVFCGTISNLLVRPMVSVYRDTSLPNHDSLANAPQIMLPSLEQQTEDENNNAKSHEESFGNKLQMAQIAEIFALSRSYLMQVCDYVCRVVLDMPDMSTFMKMFEKDQSPIHSEPSIQNAIAVLLSQAAIVLTDIKQSSANPSVPSSLSKKDAMPRIEMHPLAGEYLLSVLTSDSTSLFSSLSGYLKGTELPPILGRAFHVDFLKCQLVANPGFRLVHNTNAGLNLIPEIALEHVNAQGSSKTLERFPLTKNAIITQLRTRMSSVHSIEARLVWKSSHCLAPKKANRGVQKERQQLETQHFKPSQPYEHFANERNVAHEISTQIASNVADTQVVPDDPSSEAIFSRREYASEIARRSIQSDTSEHSHTDAFYDTMEEKLRYDYVIVNEQRYDAGDDTDNDA